MNTRARHKEVATAATAPTLPDDLIESLANVDRFAVEQLADFDGPRIFNPLIGHTPTETLDNLEQILSLLYDLQTREPMPLGSMGGIVLLTQTAWAAAQYEAFRAKKTEVAA